MAEIRGILFDLGDTILDFGPVDTLDLFEQGAHLTYDYLRQLGQPLPPFHVYHRRQLRAIRWAYFKSRIVRREFNSLDILGRVGIAMGQRLTPEQYQELAWLWYQPLSRQAKVEPELSGVLSRLASEGLRLGIVSNTFIPGQVLDRHLRQEGLLEFFPVRVYSCDVTYRKPDPRIFAYALQKLNLPAREVIFVGDSMVADIGGAKSAGMTAVLKDPTGRKRHSRIRPDHVVRFLRDLPGIVRLPR